MTTDLRVVLLMLQVEILFLDEPTTGLDPVSRRRVWETINWMKKDRVVVLTTHNMVSK
jgi:ABC-type multidrug transport system ATPase subunit